MAWHLNLEHGYYSRRISKDLKNYSNQFGVKDEDDKIILGTIDFDLIEMEENKTIRIEDNKDYYRVIIWYDNPKFYVSTTRGSESRFYLAFSYNRRPQTNLVIRQMRGDNKS